MKRKKARRKVAKKKSRKSPCSSIANMTDKQMLALRHKLNKKLSQKGLRYVDYTPGHWK